MSGATEASTDTSGSPSDTPTEFAERLRDNGVRDILAVADQVLTLERNRASDRTESDEALEWHEVIELQAFIERKAWIEEKTKFLGTLPPIEVFTGLDAVRESATVIPGLPTREELKAWLLEHDRIEKETEIFDSGELKKLKKFTKAAAQRNLSPADTDLIEIALTTIYALDKLLHLLRDRSENLDSLGVRLTWEERRIAAWKDLRELLDDLREFLATRARWSPSVYENLEVEEPTPGEHVPKRRGSMVSTTSESSSASMVGYSRGARYKLAEAISQEAAKFASRTSSLRHTKIALAGKSLDKLIEGSRRPVPDELLDEQDKLENKGITEMEDIGKFIMQTVLQWKKADEFYVETLKDKSDAQTLLEEIEVAKLSHPTARQDASFMSRTSALNKRLLLRGNPATSPMFPKPEHPHIPDQPTYTAQVVEQLSSEMASAVAQVKKLEFSAREYHAVLEAVKQVEQVCKSASDLSSKFSSLVDRMQNGITTSGGDGSPPDLSTEICLDPTRHAVYLSLFPSFLEELQHAHDEAGPLLINARATILRLDFPGVDPQFKTDSAATIKAFEASQTAAAKAKKVMVARIDTLSQVRKIWQVTDQLFHEAGEVRDEIMNAMSRQMWRQQVRHDAPPTPESPTTSLPAVSIAPSEVIEQLNQLRERVAQDVTTPLSKLNPSLTPVLREYLAQSSSALESFLKATSDTVRFWDSVQKQAVVMGIVRDEVHSFQIRIEDLKVRYDKAAQDVFAGALVDDAIVQTEDALALDLNTTRSAVRGFLEELPRRIPFVDETKVPVLAQRSSPRRRTTSLGSLSLDVLVQAAQPSLPFDPATIDKGVRTDSNTYSMMLSGALKALESKADYFQLVKRAHTVDLHVTHLVDELNRAGDASSDIQTSLAPGEERLSSQRISELLVSLEGVTRTHEDIVGRSLPLVREAFEDLRSTSGSIEVGTREAVVSARHKAVENAELQFGAWQKSVMSLKQQLADAHKAELHRSTEEARLREEQERLDAESQALRAREQAAVAEAQRLEALELARVEREKADAEEKERRERERVELEERERLERLAREEAEAEARRRRETEEMERLEKDKAERLEKERLEREREESEARARAEAEERARLEQERVEAEERERRERQEAIAQAEREEQEQENRRLIALRLAEESALSNIPLETVDEVSFSINDADDVFGVRTTSSTGLSPEMGELSVRIFSLRKRLRSIGINEAARPTRANATLPQDDIKQSMQNAFIVLANEAATLPPSVSEEPVVDADLRSLRSEILASKEMLSRVTLLADFAALLHDCDNALSDLLEHIDSYPSPPVGPLATSHSSDTSLPPEEQLSARLSFTRDMLSRMKTLARVLSEDPRVPAEHERILQTWIELEAMALDRINGQKSRPASVISSGRSSRASVIKSSSHATRTETPPKIRASLDVPRPRHSIDKKGTFSKLSASPGKFLSPPPPNPNARRAASGSSVNGGASTRSSSRLSIASSVRSVSGPMSASTSGSSVLFGTTFSSRQRTSSVTSNGSSFVTPPMVKRVLPNLSTSRPRAQTGTRTSSPAVSDASYSQGRSSLNLPRPSASTSHSSWSRAPRLSFPTQPKSPPSSRSTAQLTTRKPYVANPKNKLDVAVGDVMNKLPVDIKIELVSDTWKDQSGKYWIGDMDPKLCFCRILRSQTVMVRVGGGWQELSKFIKDHFADAFRLLPEISPPRMGIREEKWISSTSLAQATENMSPMSPPKTPEPKSPYLPSFALSTPSGKSPQSLKGSPSSGSPLHALQFIRRADLDNLSYRPETPTRSTRSGASSVLNTPSRHPQPAWRP